MMLPALPPLLCAALAAQAPTSPVPGRNEGGPRDGAVAASSPHGAPGRDPGSPSGFFQRDPKTVMVACADKARAARPKDSRALATFGRVYLAAGERERALDAFRRAEELAPGDPATLVLIAEAWLDQGEGAQATPYAKRLADLAPRNRKMLARLGGALVAAGLKDAGLPLLEKAHHLDPKDWNLAVEAGKAFLLARDPDTAALWFQRALQDRMEEDQVWTAVALAYAQAAPKRPSRP